MIVCWICHRFHSNSSNTYKQYEYSWAKFQLSQIRVMSTYAMESCNFLFFNTFAKMLKHLFVAFNIIVYGVYIDVGKK